MITGKEAKYQKKINHDNQLVQCLLCPNECVLSPNQRGICRKRVNRNGVLITETYGNICASHIDPIEKKPLYHYYPGSLIYSVGGNACNLKCKFCQNYEISQFDVSVIENSPEQLLQSILKTSCKSLAFTYSEPIMMIEFIQDCISLLKANNIKIIMVSNGYINQNPLMEIVKDIDAWNVDLKSISDDFYHSYCSARIDTVMKNIEIISRYCHLEISFLVIPGLNDSIEETKKLSDFIGSINPNIPLHINRYHPAYLMNIPQTPLETLIRLYHTAKKNLNYVYLGNTELTEFNHTYCHVCQNILIERKIS
ncbi:MAG: AmmeMemoRadiSam system radical SAM enzyme, partial [Candidatus Cloacimonetes bacterium]|nr:AmmeMemoRadiSam system radical SAM enzyme [Candidatus Cloacimonadota bacterium]